MRPIIWTFGIVLLGLAIGAQAAHPQNDTHRYRWVDATGLPHYSDSLSVDALKYGYDVINASGRVVRHVPAQMSGARRATAEARAAQAEADRQAALKQMEKDRQMLMAYPTEASFKAAQHARIDSLDQQIRTTRMNLDAQEQNLAQLLDHAAGYSTRGEPVPDKLGQRIAAQRQAVTAQRRLLEKQQAKRVDLDKDVKAELAHYRELRTRQQSRYGQ